MQKTPLSPIDFWESLLVVGETDIPPLHKLAIHVLSICPTAANCERLFSVLNLLMTDRRTRLTKENLLNIAELRLHLRDEHARKNTKQKLKRHFGERPAPQIEMASTGKFTSLIPYNITYKIYRRVWGIPTP